MTSQSLMEVDTSSRDLCPSSFLQTLFGLLDEYQIRYCVLHSWDTLPEELRGDLDLVVHPADVGMLSRVFRELQNKGYPPVQCINNVVKSYYYVFVASEGQGKSFVCVDVSYEHRRGGLIFSPGDVMVAGRRRQGCFWVPQPKTEFVYLLIKKTWKQAVPPHQQQRLRGLVEQLGEAEAEELAGQVYGNRWKRPVVRACMSGTLNNILRRLRRPLWCKTIVRDPLNPVRYLLADLRRLIHRWLRPTGLYLAVLDPDGVADSGLLERVVQRVQPAFWRHRVFHWRPMFLWRRKYNGTMIGTGTPAPGSRIRAIARVSALWLDYWLGYWFIVRPMLARSGLVVFEHHVYELFLDPGRYCRQCPDWFARLVARIIPRPDLSMLMAADPKEEVYSLGRKASSNDGRGLSAACDQAKDKLPPIVLIETQRGPDQAVAEASRAVLEHQANRIRRQGAFGLALEVEQANG